MIHFVRYLIFLLLFLLIFVSIMVINNTLRKSVDKRNVVLNRDINTKTYKEIISSKQYNIYIWAHCPSQTDELL